jgi:CheY-like chemotaxis protein
MSPGTEPRPRVLVVDDNRDAAETLSELLAYYGYEVATCYDGPEALATAERFEPDACVLDLTMPGMDGYELARRLRQRTPDRPPVLATVTAYSDLDHLQLAAEAGFDLYFTKPANAQEVAERIRRRD